MFQGATALNLDAKGRLAVPTRHRDGLQSGDGGKQVLTAHPHRCVLLYPAPAWEPIRARSGTRCVRTSADLSRITQIRLLREAGNDGWPGQSFRNMESGSLGKATGRVVNEFGQTAARNGELCLVTSARSPRNEAGAHRAVLLNEAVDALSIKGNGTYVDATFGRGGHSREILSRLGISGKLIAIDRDPEALASAAAITDSRLALFQMEFGRIGRVAAQADLSGVDGVLLDLGVSSPQLDSAVRGFSFRLDGPLDMRMDPGRGETA